ncbi:MAG: hypothetical protein AAF602_15465 [Myxococcota bacterium]
MNGAYSGMALLVACGGSGSGDPTGAPAPTVDSGHTATDDPSQTDVFPIVSAPAADVLFVVDDSGSIEDVQDRLVAGFPSLLTPIEAAALDYHIGVVSTDIDDPTVAGLLRESDGYRFLTPDVPNPVEVFAGMAQLGTEGSGDEKGLGAVYTALELEADAPQNEGFDREGVALHVVVVSDEDDTTESDLTTVDEFVRWFDSLEASIDARAFSSFVCFPGCGATTPGVRYLEVTKDIGGLAWNIQDDLGEGLARLGTQIGSVGQLFELEGIPVVETIDVRLERRVNGQDVTIIFEPAVFDTSVSPPTLVDGEWIYDESTNTISFAEFVAVVGDTVSITYDVVGSVRR